MKSKTSDEIRKQLIIKVKRQSRNPGGRIWRTLYEDLQAARRARITVNVGDLQRHHSRGQILVVPGKVLGDGVIENKLDIAAFSFSAQARTKIESKGGKCLTIEELMEKNPTGKNARIIS
ncbi:MAG: 50S ribosomal protein L18e [Promethearchaeota archaeon]